MTDLPPGYPVKAEADVVLRDGSVCRLRPIKPSDADLIRRFHAAQSDESIYLRFFAPMRNLSDRDIKRFTEVDYHDRMALVATTVKLYSTLLVSPSRVQVVELHWRS